MAFNCDSGSEGLVIHGLSVNLSQDILRGGALRMCADARNIKLDRVVLKKIKQT